MIRYYEHFMLHVFPIPSWETLIGKANLVVRSLDLFKGASISVDGPGVTNERLVHFKISQVRFSGKASCLSFIHQLFELSLVARLHFLHLFFIATHLQWDPFNIHHNIFRIILIFICSVDGNSSSYKWENQGRKLVSWIHDWLSGSSPTQQLYFCLQLIISTFNRAYVCMRT